MSKYEKNERYLTEILLNNIKSVKSFSFTSGRICYDCLITTVEDKIIITEVKVRKFELEKYDDYILQVDKLLGLIKRAKQTNASSIYYINFFESPEPAQKDFIIFNLTPRILKWKVNKPEVKKMWMNAATYISSDHKVAKEVILLNYDDKTDGKGTIFLN